MLATNVDVPVFFRILIPSRNVVNGKGQLPPRSFQGQAHTVTEPQTQAHRVTESQSQARTVTELSTLLSSSLSVGRRLPSLRLYLVCLVSSFSSYTSSLSLDLGAVVSYSLSLDLLSVVVVLLLTFPGSARRHRPRRSPRFRLIFVEVVVLPLAFVLTQLVSNPACL